MATTTGKTMRIPDLTWDGSLAAAKVEDTSVTAKVVAFLDWYRAAPDAEMPTRPADPPPAAVADLADMVPLGHTGEALRAFVDQAIREKIDRELRREARAKKTAD